MPNYYEMLKIQPTASASEVEAAIEQQYNQWRRLVAHHDQVKVNQANQALMTLEQIRATLMDPEKRAVYDAAIGVSGQQLGGLADPEMLFRANPLAAPISPPASVAAKPQPQAVERTDAWICTNPRCGKANPIGQQFCSQCGTVIGYACPKCGKLSELSKRYCPHCGVAKEEHFRGLQQNSIQQLQQSMQEVQAEIGRHQGLLQRFYVSPRAAPGIADIDSPGCLFNLFLLFLGVLPVLCLGYLYFYLGSFEIVYILIAVVYALVAGYLARFLRKVILNFITVKPAIKERLKSLESEMIYLQQQIARVQMRRYGEDQPASQ